MGARAEVDPGPYRQGPEKALIARYIPLVRRIAYHLQVRVPPSVEVDDLIQAGFMGLLDALDKVPEPELEPRFERYASLRIRGAMIDALRAIDPMPRRTRARLRRAQAALNNLEQALGHPPDEREIAARLRITLEEYHALLRDANAAQVLHIEDFEQGMEGPLAPFPCVGNPEPLERLEDERFQAALAECIERLPERERGVLALYYQEEMNLKEIGNLLGVSESRVSQILRQASLRLRGYLSGWVEPDAQDRRSG